MAVAKITDEINIICLFVIITGFKTCLHVHGVFPYLHIPHNETDSDAVQRLCYRVAISLDKALNILSGQSDSNTQHVYDVIPVVGT